MANNSSLSQEDFGSGADPSHSCEDSDFTLSNQIVRSGLYVAAMLVSVLANSLLICVVRRNRRMRTVTHHLIINMAAADLLITVLHMPYMLQVHITGSHQLHVSGALATIICKVAGFSQDFSIACSVLSLVAIAFDRFFAILFPLKKVVALSRASRVIAAVWLVSLLVCAPLLYANKMEEDGEEVYCVEDWAPVFDNDTASRDFTVVLFVFLYACPLVLISILYSSIVYRVWRRKIPGTRATGGHSNTVQRTRMQLVKLLIAVVSVFAFSWIAHHVVIFMEYFSDCPPCDWLVFIGRFLGHVNSAVNPCMYFVLSRDYRKGLKQFWQGMCSTSAYRRDVNSGFTGFTGYNSHSFTQSRRQVSMETVARDSAHEQIMLTGLSPLDNEKRASVGNL